MAQVAKDLATAGFDTSTGLFAPQIAGNLTCGENIDPASPCYIASDGKVYMSDGTAAGAAARVDGWSAKTYKLGQSITLLGVGQRLRYSAGTLTPGMNLYLGAGKGTLADAATTGGTGIIARAINSTDIRAVVNYF